MADWDRSDVFSLAPSMHPPRFMWLGEDDTYDLEEEKAVIRKHYNRAVEILDGGEGYDALKGMKERLDTHHSKAKQAESRYESRRNYARLQFGLMERKIISIARERVEGEDDEAVEEEANQILDEPMGEHWETEDGTFRRSPPTEVWSTMAVGSFNADERLEDKRILLSDLSIHFRPEKDESWGQEFDEDHLHSTDKRTFDGDETWQDAWDSIHQRWEHLEEQHERAANTRELLRFRLGVIETVLYRLEAYGSVEEMTESEAGDIARERRRDTPKRMMDWEINAAQLYAYVQEHGQPSSMEELYEETKVSPRQAWDRLKEQGYGIGEGVTGLVSALEEWAPEFEEEYGKEKAREAARKGLFKWPDQHEA